MRKRFMSFLFAFRGIRLIVVSQHNFRIHLTAAVLVIFAGFMLQVSAAEWCMLVLAIGLVTAMEAMNSAVEKLVDHVSPGFHKDAGMVKDMAAGAVLLAALAAAAIGLIIFIPRIITLIY